LNSCTIANLFLVPIPIECPGLSGLQTTPTSASN